MAKLVVINARLEKEVNRKGKALDRVNEQFHTDEADMKKLMKRENILSQKNKNCLNK